MYQYHTELEDPRVWSLTDEEISKDVKKVIGREGRFSTACYTEHGVQGILYLQAKHCSGGKVNFEQAIWDAVNALGECAVRRVSPPPEPRDEHTMLSTRAPTAPCATWHSELYSQSFPPKSLTHLTKASDTMTLNPARS